MQLPEISPVVGDQDSPRLCRDLEVFRIRHGPMSQVVCVDYVVGILRQNKLYFSGCVSIQVETRHLRGNVLQLPVDIVRIGPIIGQGGFQFIGAQVPVINS